MRHLQVGIVLSLAVACGGKSTDETTSPSQGVDFRGDWTSNPALLGIIPSPANGEQVATIHFDQSDM